MNLARALYDSKRPNWPLWNDIPWSEKLELLEKVNEGMRREGGREVDMDVLRWRMSQVVRDLRRTFGKLSCVFLI